MLSGSIGIESEDLFEFQVYDYLHDSAFLWTSN